MDPKPRLSRYFRPLLAKLQKFVAANTAVLRIADLEGVYGAFCLVINSLRTPRSLLKIVFNGVSKGGAGTFIDGLTAGWRFVAVDPIVSDRWCEEYERD